MAFRKSKKIKQLIKKILKKFTTGYFINSEMSLVGCPISKIININSGKKFRFNNIIIYGSSRFALLDKRIFFRFSHFNQQQFFNKYLTDEEANKIIEVKNNSVFLVSKGILSNKIGGTSLSVSHPTINNIYHFFIEACFDLIEAHRNNISFDNIIVDQDLNPKFYSFLTKIVKFMYPGKKITIFRISKFETLTLENLISFPNKNSQIHWLRNHKTKPMHYWNKMWLIHAQSIFSALYEKPTKRNIILFLIRNSTFRNTINERSIINLLKKSYIIKIFDSGKKSFRSAFYHINSSRIIVGQTSASFANILFAKQKKTFITWKYNGPEQNKSLMKELFSFLGHTLIELDASPVISQKINLDWQAFHITQSNLYILPDTVLSALNEKK